MARNEVKWGAILSYLLIIINSVYGLVITPYIVASVGDVEFGVYKSISSLSTSLMVLDLGLGGMVMRYIAKYRAEQNKEKINELISMALGEGSLLMALVVAVCSVVYFLIPHMYAKGFSDEQVRLAQQLFLIMACNLVLHIVENVQNGIITGHNRFALGNGLKLARIILRIVLIYALLYAFESSLILAMVDLALTVLLIVAEYIYIRWGLHTPIRISFRGWDRSLFGESFKYTMLLFLTSIAAQINNNLDNVIIGAVMGAGFVTVYSMGLLIFGMFEHLSTAISGVMLPTVTNILNEEDGMTKVQRTIVQAGRVQFLLLGAALVGFAVIGKNFIQLWLGDGYEDVYAITLILMVPALFELCVNVCLAVLRAKNMLEFRTGVLFATTSLNAVVTIVGVRLFGYFAAAVGTALSFVIGSLIIMNVYYYKKLSFRMLRMYREILRGTWLCLILAGGAVYASSRWLFTTTSWISFLANVAVFGAVYGVTMLLFGLNKQEKRAIPIFKKLWR